MYSTHLYMYAGFMTMVKVPFLIDDTIIRNAQMFTIVDNYVCSTYEKCMNLSLIVTNSPLVCHEFVIFVIHTYSIMSIFLENEIE